MSQLLAKIARGLARDRALPLGTRLAKGRAFVAATLLARRRLRGCARVGARVRVVGRPVVRGPGAIEVGDDQLINAGPAPCEFSAAAGARLRVGAGGIINFGVLVHAERDVHIGERVWIGPYSIVSDTDFPAGGAGAGAQAPVEIGDGVWLAGRVTVRPGARIGARTVVAAGSVVEGELPPGVLAGGNPARVLRALELPPLAHADAGVPA